MVGVPDCLFNQKESNKHARSIRTWAFTAHEYLSNACNCIPRWVVVSVASIIVSASFTHELAI